MGHWCHEPPPKPLLRGIAQFNRGECFEQHETLEDLWREERRDVRRLYQGVLQIGGSPAASPFCRTRPIGSLSILLITHSRRYAS